MHERERLEDFRGGMVACRGCKRLLNFAPDRLVALVCCGILYRPEPGPVDLVIYDRVQADEWEGALVLPGPQPTIVIASEEDVQHYVTLPDEEEDYGEPEPSDEDVSGMLATAEEIQARFAERQEQIRRGRPPGSRSRGPSYD